jgi:hypothetical protein
MTIKLFFTILFKFLPEIYGIIKYLAKEIDRGVDEARLKNALRTIDKALLKAVELKDTSDLEDIFRRKQ